MDKKKSPNWISDSDFFNTRDPSSLLDCDDDDVEEFDEGFRCCVCLDLLYKPIVLACGHISCFWCVHGAMSWYSESHCPICRCQYNHFPAICELLHFMLLKMYPLAYKARERQVLEEEKKQGCFSPQLDDNLSSSPCTSSTRCSPVESVVQGMSNPLNIVEQRSPEGGSHVGLESTRTSAAEGNNLLDSNMKNETCELLSVEDVLCVACKQLLFKPAVLNCGHVYCLSCISSPAHEAVKCQLCQGLHPKGFLKVCLELDQLLEKIFPKEYALRREAAQLQPIHSQQNNPSCGVEGKGEQGLQSSSPHTCSNISWLGDRVINLHYGVGCDSCGIYPIVGERYRCIDCVEQVGFDLCEECYNTRSKLPGRFNQQHTPEHKFELFRPNRHSVQVRMDSEPSEDSSVPVHSDDASEDPEEGVPLQALSDEVPADQEEEIDFII